MKFCISLPPCGGLEGTELCVFLFPFLCMEDQSRLKSGNSLLQPTQALFKPPIAQALIKQILLRAVLIKKDKFCGIFQNDYISSPPGYTNCQNLVKLLEVKLTKLWVCSSQGMYTPEFTTFKLVHTETLTISQLHFRFSHSNSVSYGGFCLWASTLANYEFLYLPVCLSNLGSAVT